MTNTIASIENAVNKLLGLDAEALVELSEVNHEHFHRQLLGHGVCDLIPGVLVLSNLCGEVLADLALRVS
jgi:hypothetical protein